MTAARTVPLPPEVLDLLAAAAALRARFPGRKFSLDGHLVGDIGEAIAADAFGLVLHPPSHPGTDAVDADGRAVQSKLTFGRSVGLYGNCERLLIMLGDRNGVSAEVVYDGPGDPVWNAAGPMQKNGHRNISIAAVRRLASANNRAMP